MFKKITVLMLAVLMIFSSVPFCGISAFAASENTESYVLALEADTSEALLADNSSSGRISFFSRTVFDGCYGNQITDFASEIYNSLVENYVDLKKTASFEYTLANPFVFNAEISGGSIIKNDELAEIEEIIHMSLQVAMDAFLYDHPEVFWLGTVKVTYGVSASGSSVSGYIGRIEKIKIIPREAYYDASYSVSQFDSAVKAAVSAIDTEGKSRYDILKSIHDYICNNAWYNLLDENEVHTAAPVFIGDGGVVCEGYAKAFKILCDNFDIPCVLVSGDAYGAHMWNYVQLDDGKWYLVDATWDDQESRIYYTYFLANANTIGFKDVKISEERTEKNDFSSSGYKSFVYPVLSESGHTAHTHIWDDEYTVDVEPTCVQEGSKSIHCTVDGCLEKKDVTSIPVSDHLSTTAFEKQNETCEEIGYTAGVYCADCESWISGHEEIPAAGHSFKNYISDNNATCVAYGTKTARCERCEKTDTVADPDSKGEHSWKEWVAVTEATCTVSGVEKRECKNCNAYEVRNVISINHTNAYIVEATGSTCEEVGYTSGLYCPDCKLWLSGHEEIPALGHAFEIYKDDNNASCAADGTKTSKCERCDATHSLTIEGTRLPHDWNEWVSISLPSCLVGGLDSRSCKNCDASENRNIDATNHAKAYIADAVSSTCTQVGYNSGIYCPDCKLWLSGHEEIPALGHAFVNYTYNNNATCTADGTKTAKCERCDVTDTLTVEGTKLPHYWGEWQSISSPTCTADGLDIRSCKNCTTTESRDVIATNHANSYLNAAVSSTCTEIGYTAGLYCPDCNSWLYGHEEIASLGHSFENYSYDNNATCTADGTKTAKCVRCDVTDTVAAEGSKLSHDWSEWVSISSPTCTESGVEKRSCKGCTASENRTTEATNHANSYLVAAVNGTCTESGYTAGLYCPDCNSWLYGHEEIVSYGHSFKAYISDNNATCTKDGTKTATCEHCDATDTVADEGSKLAHLWSEWEIENHPTCTLEGSKARYCASCGGAETQVLEPTNHPDAYYVEGVAPSCTAVGYTDGMYCYVCDNWASGHAEIEKAPHSFTEKIVDEAHLVSAATVVDLAVYGYDCENCDAMSKTVTFTHGDRAPLGKTSKITAIQDTATITLTWTAVDYAVGYRVYQKVGNSWKALGNVTAPTARIRKLSAGTKYSFAVMAATRLDGKVVWSKEYSTISTATQAPLPTTIKTKQTTSAIQLIWNSCAGATGYRIYAVEGTEMTYLGQVKGTKATLRNLKAGKKYTYAIRPYITLDDGSVVWSAYKNYTAATSPANPTTTVTSASKGKITVKWKAVSGAESYQLYYKTGNGSYKLYKTYTSAKTVNFSNLKSGTSYTFAVRAGIKTSGGWIYGSYTPVNVKVK